jgi:lipopolysaccharide export system protein LptA
MMGARSFTIIAAAVGFVLVAVAPLQAQPKPAAPAASSAPVSKGPPNALQGFSQNRDEPVHIEAATLEVRDKDKVATFSGEVHVTQGDTEMRCKSLVVFYEQDTGDNTATTLPAADAGPGGQQRIKRLEAHGSVIVTQKDQIVTGNLGIFEMKTNTVTMTGAPVVMTQGKNVLRGDRLVVDLTSGVSRVESGKAGSGRVEGLFLPGSGPPGTAVPGAPPPPALPTSPPPAASSPGRTSN